METSSRKISTPVYSNKIISLHLQTTNQCKKSCPHVDVCYHHNKNIDGDAGTFNKDLIFDWADRGYKIYESVCELPLGECLRVLALLQRPNYSVTLSYFLFDKHRVILGKYKEQLQITVYSLKQALSVHDYQKLFLIKDQQTFSFFKDHIQNPDLKMMHFVIDKNWIDRNKAGNIIAIYASRKSDTITLDSTFMSYILNGRDIYEDDYIDITYDGTLRRSPFDKDGVPIDFLTTDVDELFNIKIPSTNDKYRSIFSKE